MTDTLFPAFPDDARLWIYAAERDLSDVEQAHLENALARHLSGWTSHGRTVHGATQLLHDRFLLVAAMLDAGDISGCGIDASVHAVEAAANEIGVAWASPLLVYYRDDAGDVQAVPRSAFRKAVQAGDVTAATHVFDPSLTTVGALRESGFERPAGASWHARVFRVPSGGVTAPSR